ncbi:hypothetical protein GGQ88_003837 [Novosphingobium hassiacum]|uniref:DUF2285 domain-containing protein n=1 Tax=Novosphingobium hassiacum TaxID=173676 RepID=A0A7W5ZYU2_9SPHN|nr:DUF2285 domain-containing protein [Novosphingobium hassiacum]MBB3862536.1 hypothetical protein [Novosphingobium hassiacum]
MNSASFSETLPHCDHVTDYDLSHLRTYLQLLDIAAQGRIDWTEAVYQVFEIEPAEDPVRARRLYDAHLDRARWMTRHGYRQLAAFERTDPRFR